MRSKTSKHSQTPFCIHHFRSNIVCNEKFYTIFMNFKTKFKIFSLKSPPPQKIRLNGIKNLYMTKN
ncbi:hypothetical protein DDP44_05810 [Helicobacter pylori]|nr:hypothetical protein DDP44_05810 [Helicobacter pylori]